MSIRNRWIAFINSEADKMKRTDPKGAELFRKVQKANIPDDENSLEWGMAYVRANQAMVALLDVYSKQGRHEEGYILSSFLLELNGELGELSRRSKMVRVPKEFVKEVKF